jgi:HlyD family secretion protein
VTKRGKKIIWWAVAIIIVLFVSYWLVHKKAPTQSATTVRLETLVPGQLQEFISAPGEIEPKTQVEISAKVSARVEELPFKEGDRVKAGDLVIRLDAKEYESRLKSIEAGYKAQQAQVEVTKSQITVRKAQLKGTNASLEQAKSDYQRQKQLLDTHDISQSTFELAKQKYEEIQSQYESSIEQIRTDELSLVVAQHNLDSQQAQIDEAKDALEYTIIRSPIEGIVTRINAEVGEMVMTGTMNNPGTVIMIVADLSKMLLVAQVDEADVGKLALGQEANIRVKAFWNQVYHGKVDHIALTNDSSQSTGTKYYRTEILIEGDVSKLYSGLTADVDIFTRKHTDIVKVPSQAILTRKGDDLPADIRKNPLVDPNKTDATVVFRYIDKKAVATPVKIGPGDTTHIIIEQGLNVGEQIVIGPYKVLDSLIHNQAVRDEKEIEAENKVKNKSGTEKKPLAPKAS